MLGTNQYRTANDNDPAWRNPALDIIDYKTFARDQSVEKATAFGSITPNLPSLPLDKLPTLTPLNNRDLKSERNTVLVPWIMAMVVSMLAFTVLDSVLLKIMSTLAVIVTGLRTANIAHKNKKFQRAELANLSAIIGGIGVFFTANTFFGSPITTSDSLGVIAVGSLILASVIRSPVCMIASICSAMLWTVLGFMGTVPHSLAFIAFPVIAAVQLYYASVLRSKVSVIAATLTAYAWLIGHCFLFVSSGSISILMAAGILFIAALTQYRWGKAFEDEISFGSPIHTHFGWIVAIVSALTAQHFWLFPDNAIWQNTSSSFLGGMAWQLITALALTAIYLSGLVRWKHGRVTKIGAFAATLIAALLPLTIWAEPAINMIVTAIPGMYASPTIGLIIAGGILASGIGMALNGIRRNNTKMIMLAMLAIGAQIVMLMTPSLITFENVMVFGLSLIFALGLGGLMAGKSLLKRADSPSKLLRAA